MYMGEGREKRQDERLQGKQSIIALDAKPIRDSGAMHALSLFCTERLSICAEFNCSENTSLTSVQLLFEHLYSLLSR